MATVPQDDLDSLDRGVRDNGLTAAQAMARVEALELRLAAYQRSLRLALEYAGIQIPPLHLV